MRILIGCPIRDRPIFAYPYLAYPYFGYVSVRTFPYFDRSSSTCLLPTLYFNLYTSTICQIKKNYLLVKKYRSKYSFDRSNVWPKKYFCRILSTTPSSKSVDLGVPRDAARYGINFKNRGIPSDFGHGRSLIIPCRKKILGEFFQKFIFNISLMSKSVVQTGKIRHRLYKNFCPINDVFLHNYTPV